VKKYLTPLKFKQPENNIFFWGCLHLNHDPKWENPLWKMRGFNSVQEHNQFIEDSWRKKLNEESIIFLLGDTCFGYEAEEYMNSFFTRVPFKEVYWLPGNHTAGWKQFLEKSNEEGLIDKGDQKIYLTPNYLEMFINGHSLVASHYPIASWNGQGKGSYMVHAHVHGTLEKSELGKILYRSRTKEVSVEKCPSPISFNEIKKSFDQSIITFDHHGKDTQNPF
jgi:calcineurin-like phosphoesterase family protein